MNRLKRFSLFILACLLILVLYRFEQTVAEAISAYGWLVLFTVAVGLGYYLLLDATHNATKYVAVRITNRKNSTKR